LYFSNHDSDLSAELPYQRLSNSYLQRNYN